MSTPLSSRVGLHQGRMIFFLNDQPEPPLIYALTDVPGGRWSWEEVPGHNIGQFAKADFRVFQLDLNFEDIWKEDGSWTVDYAQRQIAGVVARRADAAVMLRLHVRPPRWWMKQHPDENTTYVDAEAIPDYAGGFQRVIEDDSIAPVRTSIASDLWWKEMGAQVERFCRELARTPEGDSLMGIQVAGGIYGEWHYWGFIGHEPDASRPMHDYFRRWLKEKYKTESALREAWADKSASFEKAQVPDLPAREKLDDGLFRDPTRQRNVIDYYEAQHERVADSILYFSRIVKKSWPRPVVTGAFYGYFFSTFGRDAAGGHLAVQKVLRSPDIDFLCAPNAYYPETFHEGEPYRSRSLIDSVLLHKKLWLDEMDQDGAVKRYTDPGHLESVHALIARVRRNVFYLWTKGQGLWFYDFGASGLHTSRTKTVAMGCSGWWDFPEVLDDIRKTMDFCRRNMSQPYASEADVLVIADTGVYPHISSLGKEAVSTSLLNWGITGLQRSGAIVDLYHLDDLESLDLSRYKAVFFLNTFKLSTEKRQYITSKVAADGRHLVWFYAPGYTDGARNDIAFIEEVTGFKMTRVKASQVPQIETTKEIGGLAWGVKDEPIQPLFAVADPAAQALGHYKDSKDVAVARKKSSTHTTWFFGIGAWDSAIMKNIVTYLPVHRYSDSGDIVYAGGDNFILHTKDGGQRTVTLRDGRKIELTFPVGPHTVVLKASTGEVLLG